MYKKEASDNEKRKLPEAFLQIETEMKNNY